MLLFWKEGLMSLPFCSRPASRAVIFYECPWSEPWQTGPSCACAAFHSLTAGTTLLCSSAPRSSYFEPRTTPRPAHRWHMLTGLHSNRKGWVQMEPGKRNFAHLFPYQLLFLPLSSFCLPPADQLKFGDLNRVRLKLALRRAKFIPATGVQWPHVSRTVVKNTVKHIE